MAIQPNLRQRVEALIVTTIEEKLKEENITGFRAQEIARKVLEYIPEDITDEQLLKELPKFTNETVELAGVVHLILKEQDEKIKSALIPKLQMFFNKNNGQN